MIRRMTRIAAGLLLCLAASVATAQDTKADGWLVPPGERRVVVSQVGEKDAARVIVENGVLRLVINPSRGGRIENLIHKRTKRDVTMPPTDTTPGGLFSDQVWQQSYWHGDWNRAPYALQIIEAGPAAARVQFTAAGRLWEGITIRKTFTVRRDDAGQYWSLTNPVLEHHAAEHPGKVRNALALASSDDLRQWEMRGLILHHPDIDFHGFQYVDWLIDGDDLLVASRTAFDDGLGGAHNQHDANYLTFHRVTGFGHPAPTVLPH